MPSRNTLKDYTHDTYYHVYNRGVAKQSIFKDDNDYAVFLNLLKRYLGTEPTKDKQGREYPWLHNDIKLLAICPMPNHSHLLLDQNEPKSITALLQGVCTSYTMYFNRKYKRVGHLFQGRFKASTIANDAYLEHISRYIHLNPKDYLKWNYSSLPYYLGKKKAEWISPQPILEIIPQNQYLKFLSDYKNHKEMLEHLEFELADK